MAGCKYHSWSKLFNCWRRLGGRGDIQWGADQRKPLAADVPSCGSSSDGHVSY